MIHKVLERRKCLKLFIFLLFINLNLLDCSFLHRMVNHDKLKLKWVFLTENRSEPSVPVHFNVERYMKVERGAQVLAQQEQDFLCEIKFRRELVSSKAELRNRPDDILNLPLKLQLPNALVESDKLIKDLNENPLAEDWFAVFLKEEMHFDSQRMKALEALQSRNYNNVKLYLQTTVNIRTPNFSLLLSYLRQTGILPHMQSSVHHAMSDMRRGIDLAIKALTQNELERVEYHLTSGYQNEFYSEIISCLLLEASRYKKVDMGSVRVPTSWFFWLYKNTKSAIEMRTRSLIELNKLTLTATIDAEYYFIQSANIQEKTQSIQRQLLAMGLIPWDSEADQLCEPAREEWQRINDNYQKLPEIIELRVGLEAIVKANQEIEEHMGPKNPDAIWPGDPPPEQNAIPAGQEEFFNSRRAIRESAKGALTAELNAWKAREQGDWVSTWQYSRVARIIQNDFWSHVQKWPLSTQGFGNDSKYSKLKLNCDVARKRGAKAIRGKQKLR